VKNRKSHETYWEVAMRAIKSMRYIAGNENRKIQKILNALEIEDTFETMEGLKEHLMNIEDFEMS